MAKAIIRDDVTPATVFDANTGTFVSIHAGKVFETNDPFVSDHRYLFDQLVEQATSSPGEKRNTRRAA